MAAPLPPVLAMAVPVALPFLRKALTTVPPGELARQIGTWSAGTLTPAERTALRDVALLLTAPGGL